tara:strand:+ start:40 stop:660 length:621 start_codon:yes stop_codon:yes gene_type:complete
MSKYKEEIKQIHENTDFRVTFAGITQLSEFVYAEHNGSVQPGLEYHIHYTNDKREVYMTGGAHTADSKIIERVDGKNTSFKQYRDIKNVKKQTYPNITPAAPSENDYSVGSFTRYFTQKANDSNAVIFEISEDDFDNQNNLFIYISLQWRLSGTKFEVSRFNEKKMAIANRDLPGVIRNLFSLQYWRAPKNSPEDLQKKLSLLRKL